MATKQKVTLGQWKNAPLAMVIARLDFSKPIEPNQLGQKIKERCKEIFSTESDLKQRTVIDKEANFKIEELEVSIGKILSNLNKTYCAFITRDTIVFSASSYTDHKKFLQLWEKIIDPLFTAKKIEVTYKGLRYIDFIIPTKGRKPEAYMREVGKVPSILKEQNSVVFNAFKYDLEESRSLQIQYSSMIGHPRLPPEFSNLLVVPKELTKKYKKGTPSAVLDMDCMERSRKKETHEEVIDSFFQLHKRLSAAFKNLVSDFAIAEWKE